MKDDYDEDDDGEAEDEEEDDDEQLMSDLNKMSAELDTLLSPNSSPSSSSSSSTTALVEGKTIPFSLPVPWRNEKNPIVLYDGEKVADGYLVFESPYPMPAPAPLSPDASSKKTKRFIVAAGIIRQEGRIIERMLQSLVPFVGGCVIIDTGSTDNTIDVVKRFMLEHKWPGKIYYSPFVDFGRTRTLAAKVAYNCGDYLCLTDADYKWRLPESSSSFLYTMDKDVYRIGTVGGCIYYRPHLIRSTVKFCYRRRTHEYIDLPGGITTADLTDLMIDHIGDGGYKADKFIRDRKLLMLDLKEYGEDDGRSLFYLAQTDRCAGAPADAWEWYQKRARIRDWVEEVYYSLYQCASCSRDLKRPLVHWMRECLEAFIIQPARSESLYDMVLHLTDRNHKLACAVGSLTFFNDFPGTGCLFIDDAIHRWSYWYRMSIACGYCPEYRLAGFYMLRRLITERKYPADSQDSFMQNNLSFYLQYYTERFEECKKKKWDPIEHEKERLQCIYRADEFRKNSKFQEALDEYRKVVPLVPESVIGRYLRYNWKSGKIFGLTRFDRLTAYKNGRPFAPSTPVSLQSFFFPKEKEDKEDKQKLWMREIQRCYGAFWCGVMKKQLRHSAWDYAGDLLDAGRLSIGTPHHSWVLYQIQFLLQDTELSTLSPSLVALIQHAASQDLSNSCFAFTKPI